MVCESQAIMKRAKTSGEFRAVSAVSKTELESLEGSANDFLLILRNETYLAGLPRLLACVEMAGIALLREMLGSSASDNKGEGWESRAGSLDRAARRLRLRHNLLLPYRAVVIANAKEKRRCESG